MPSRSIAPMRSKAPVDQEQAGQGESLVPQGVRRWPSCGSKNLTVTPGRVSSWLKKSGAVRSQIEMGDGDVDHRKLLCTLQLYQVGEGRDNKVCWRNLVGAVVVEEQLLGRTVVVELVWGIQLGK